MAWLYKLRVVLSDAAASEKDVWVCVDHEDSSVACLAAIARAHHLHDITSDVHVEEEHWAEFVPGGD